MSNPVQLARSPEILDPLQASLLTEGFVPVVSDRRDQSANKAFFKIMKPGLAKDIHGFVEVTRFVGGRIEYKVSRRHKDVTDEFITKQVATPEAVAAFMVHKVTRCTGKVRIAFRRAVVLDDAKLETIQAAIAIAVRDILARAGEAADVQAEMVRHL